MNGSNNLTQQEVEKIIQPLKDKIEEQGREIDRLKDESKDKDSTILSRNSTINSYKKQMQNWANLPEKEKKLKDWESKLSKQAEEQNKREDKQNDRENKLKNREKDVEGKEDNLDNIIQQRVKDKLEEDGYLRRVEWEEIEKQKEKNDEIRKERLKELIPASRTAIVVSLVFLLVVMPLIGYFTYWGVRLHIADSRSETEYNRYKPRNEKEIMDRLDEYKIDGYIYERSKYIKALVNAQFTKVADNAALRALCAHWSSLRYVPKQTQRKN